MESSVTSEFGIELEAPFNMANLAPQHTGLPFVIWISQKGGARHDIPVKVSPTIRAVPEELATVALRPELRVLHGEVAPADLQVLRRWVALNEKVLLDYWTGEIDTMDALINLCRIE